MKDQYKIVGESVVSVYSKPNFNSEIINQALIWDKLLVLDRFLDKWYKVQQKDGYVGWVNSFYLKDDSVYFDNTDLHDKDNWYYIKNRFLEVNINAEKKILSFGSIIPCVEQANEKIIILPDNKKIKINKNSLVKTTDYISLNDIIDYAKKLLGVPYLWGGRSSFGYDCSGFIQTLISFFDINFPRDAKDQVNYSKMFKINDNYKKGDLIFFKDGQNIAHVAVLINEKDYMHSSGKIKINSLSSSSNFFDEQLYNNIYGVYRYRS